MKFQTAQERHDAVKNMPDPPQYVEGLITDGLTLLAAKSGYGKSWYCMQAAISIATGRPFLGRPTKKAKVLYLDFESSDKLADNRLMAQLGDQPIPENLYVARNASEWTYENGNLERQLQYVRDETEIKVIIIDIIQPIKPKMGKKETEYDVAYNFGNLVKSTLYGTGIAVIGVMHCNKGAYNEEDPFNNALGSVGWQGVSDTMIVLQKKHRSDVQAYMSATGRIDEEVNEYIVWHPETLTWETVGSAKEIQAYAEQQTYEQKPVTRIVKRLLGDDITWHGTAKDVLEKLPDLRMSADSIGRYLNSNQCRELQSRDGINILKRRSSHGTEYIITKDLDGTLTNPETINAIFDKIA